MAFEQQPRESAKAFAAFSLYRDMGPERSLAAVAEKLGKSKVMMERWSRKFDWPARVAAHGAHLAMFQREAAEAVARNEGAEAARTEARVKEEAWREGEELIAMAREFKQRWRDTTRVPGFESVVRALELAFKLKAFSVGVALDVRQVNTTVGGADGGPIRIEIEAALEKVYGKPIPGEVIEVQSSECRVQNGPSWTGDHEGNESNQSLLTSAATEDVE